MKDLWDNKNLEELAMDVGRHVVYELYYKDVLERQEIKYISLHPHIVEEVVRILHESGILQKLAEQGVALTKDIIKGIIVGLLIDYLRKQRKTKEVFDMSHFRKIAIKGIQKDGTLAIYDVSEPIKIHPYQNIALFGIEGTPVLDFRNMNLEGTCFKLGRNSTLFLKNLKIRKYTTQKLFEGDGRVIYDERDVIIEDIMPPEEETEEIHEREGYLEIEFR